MPTLARTLTVRIHDPYMLLQILPFKPRLLRRGPFLDENSCISELDWYRLPVESTTQNYVLRRSYFCHQTLVNYGG